MFAEKSTCIVLGNGSVMGTEMSQIEFDFEPVDRIVNQTGTRIDSVVPILQAIQQHYRYLPEEALRRVCERTEITPAQITGVSTFYESFRHRPQGRHLLSVCHGTACHVNGSGMIQDAVEQSLELEPGSDTDRDNRFTVVRAACFGCCTLSPVIRIDEETYGHLTAQEIPTTLDEFLDSATNLKLPWESGADLNTEPSPRIQNEIHIGLDSCCVAQGCGKVYAALTDVLKTTGADVKLKQVGCQTMCHQTPLVEIVPAKGSATFYAKVKPENARDLVLQHFRPRGVARRVGHWVSRQIDRWHSDEVGSTLQQHRLDMRQGNVCKFLGPQKHIATEHYGRLNGLDIDEYIRSGGFQGLKTCLTEKGPAAIIDDVRRSGLRGRGGAGFPTHRKWEMMSQQESPVKYIICNGDEGDPGAFMDRMLLESFPYRVIEGMIIAARAVGAHQGFLYIRAEYPAAVRQMTAALERCRKHGILGERVMDTPFSLDLSIKQGAGAFVCGEETALIHSIEGGRGTPRVRPPYPVESGLWGKPTLINNVETFSLLPWIFRNGPEAFAELGTGTSRGTKVFALAGKVVRGGLIEVPMGVTIREIVEEIGGGVGPGRRFKAVQIGGPSGGCVPAALAETSVDYESLAEVGAIMGSGGMVVLDDTDCMVDIARFFLRFTQKESCGKCTFCRVGTKRLLDIMDRICTGKGRKGDLQQLEQLSGMVSAGSLCGLGKTAPNPVLSTLRHFRDEYEAHLNGRCPAGKCQDLIHYEVTRDCIGCTLCAQHCPVDAIPFTPYQTHKIDDDKCIRCDTCRTVCPESAVIIASGGSPTALSCLP
jgi:NADH-quinone oxidoreductase subunit F